MLEYWPLESAGIQLTLGIRWTPTDPWIDSFDKTTTTKRCQNWNVLNFWGCSLACVSPTASTLLFLTTRAARYHRCRQHEVLSCILHIEAATTEIDMCNYYYYYYYSWGLYYYYSSGQNKDYRASRKKISTIQYSWTSVMPGNSKNENQRHRGRWQKRRVNLKKYGWHEKKNVMKASL